MRNWFPVIRRRLGIVWGITHRNLKMQSKYPIDYLYRLFPPLKDSLYAIFIGLFVSIATPEYQTIPYSYFLLSGYIVWVSVSGSFYTIVVDFNYDLQRKNALTLYVYGASFIELALGYALMQTLNAILFSIPFIITLGLIGVNLAVDIVLLASIVFFYCCSWLFFFALALVFLGLNIVYKYTSMFQRAAYDMIALLSGLSFSVQVLPEAFRLLAFPLPTYYLLTTTRYALIDRHLPPNVSLYFLFAPIITLSVLVFSILLMKKCVRVAKKRGILWTY